MKKTVILILSSIVVFASCNREVKNVEKTIFLKKISLNAEDSIPAEPSRIQGVGHSGNYGYRTDTLNQYSAGVIESLNDSLINSSIRVCANFWIKTSNPIKGDGLALSVQENETSIFWKVFDVSEYGAKQNEWINIVDSIDVQADLLSKPGIIFKFFGFNANKKSVIDFDDINVELKKVYVVQE